MSMEKHCPGCGTTVAHGQPFCPRCGKDLKPIWESEASRVSAQMPAPPIQQGASQRPWAFSAEALADRLAAGGYVPKPIADALVAEAARTGRSFVDLVLERHQMTPAALRDAMARIFGIQAIDPERAEVDPSLIASFPSEPARRSLLLPLRREGDRLLVICYDPTAADAIRGVRRVLGLTVDLRLASRPELEPVVHRFFSPRLVALLPSGDTLDVPLEKEEIRIGRSPQNDIVLPDLAVGSQHAIVRARGSRFEIVDNGSKNGVFLNDVRIEGASLLANSDVIQIGSCVLTFKMPVPDAAHEKGGATQILTPDRLPTPIAIPKIAPVAAPSAHAPVPTLVATPALAVPVAPAAGETGKKKKKKDKDKEKEKDEEKPRKLSADRQKEYIATASRILSQVIGALATIVLGLAVAGKLPTMSCGSAGPSLDPTPFAELNAGQPFNVSGIVPIGDGRFLMCDNNLNTGLVEMQLGPDGAKQGALTVRPLAGLPPDSIDDMEGMTIAEENGKQFLFATTSLYNDVSKKTGGVKDRPAGLLRIAVATDGTLAAETVAGFREWVLANNAELAAAAGKLPDEGGLNVEGLAWDARRHALLLGVRTPVHEGKPIVVPIRVKDLAGPWNTSNLEMLSPIYLTLSGGAHEQGIRGMEWDPSRSAFLVIVGNSTSGPAGSKAPFEAYVWDGGDSGAMTKLPGLGFREKNKDAGIEQMKPEGVTYATIGGRGAYVFTDDVGGYAFVWADDPRMK